MCLIGVSRHNEEEKEEEKDVDPSLVGSLDNVYTDETEAAMNKEDDPFKTVVMNTDEATPAEMEKTVNALVLYSSEHDDSNECLSPIPSDADTCPLPEETNESGGEGLDLLGGPPPSTVSGSQELLPDIIGTTSVQGPLPDVQQANHTNPPDITPPSGTLPPDLAATVVPHQPLDLLNPEGNSPTAQNNSPLDLTKGILDV